MKQLTLINTITYCIIGIGFYLLNTFSPFITDDYFYSFVVKEGFWKDMQYTPINSMCDILESQSYAYFHQNGRVVVHSLVQGFCGLWGFGLFKVINSIVFVLLIFGVSKILSLHYEKTKVDVLLSTFMIFILIPVFGVTYLGNISCCINYLWTSCAIVWWLYFYYKKWENSLGHNIILFLYAFFVGAMQESFSIGISAAIVINYIFNIKELRGATLSLVVGFILGSSIIIFAPSNFIRFTVEHGSSFNLTNVFLTTIRVLCSLRAFWIMLCLLVICVLSKYDKIMPFIHDNRIILISIVVNILFTSIVAMNGKHQLVCIELFSIIIILLWIRYYLSYWITRHQISLMILLISATSILYVPVFQCRKEFDKAHDILVERAKSTDDGVVVAEDYTRLCMREDFLIEKYTWQNCYHTFNKRGLSLILSNGKDGNLIKSVLPNNPSDLVQMCNKDNFISDGIFKSSCEEFYIIRMNTEEMNRFYITMRPGVLGKLFARVFLRQKDYAVEMVGRVNDYNSFSADGYTYVVITDSTPIKSVQFDAKTVG